MTNRSRMCFNDSSLRFLAIGGAAIAIVVLVSTEVRAGFTTYGFGGGTGVFSVACAGPGDGGLPNGNLADNRVFFKPGSNCTVDPLTGAASESFASGNTSASGTVSSVLGQLQGSATMSTDQQSSVRFPAGFGDTGWIDTMDLGGNPQFNGQVGMAEVEVIVSGTLAVSGPNVTALLQLVVSSELGGPALHQPFYQIQSPHPGLTISDSLILDLPFIIGTPSEFLVRAMPRAMTSSQTSFGNNTSTVNFLANSVTWGGIRSVTVGGTTLPNFTAIGGTGIDWTQPFGALAVPTPSIVPLLILGLAVMGFTRRFNR